MLGSPAGTRFAQSFIHRATAPPGASPARTGARSVREGACRWPLGRDGNAINTFKAPANATLEKETDYFVVFEETETGSDTGYRLKQTTSDNEDSGKASGWSSTNDFLLSEVRDAAAATRLFRTALTDPSATAAGHPHAGLGGRRRRRAVTATPRARVELRSQGAEMAQHAQLRIDTGLQVFFCDPRSPWQRGTNENTNGLLRQYFPEVLTSIGTVLATLLLSRPHSTADRGRLSVGEPHPKPSTNCYSHNSEDVLRRPLETGQGSTTSHHAIGAGRCEARGWGWPYFSQPICGDDRSLFSPAPSPLVPRQWAQSANSLGNWRARQDSNLRPSAEKAEALSN